MRMLYYSYSKFLESWRLQLFIAYQELIIFNKDLNGIFWCVCIQRLYVTVYYALIEVSKEWVQFKGGILERNLIYNV
jgi:hypothetical protein